MHETVGPEYQKIKNYLQVWIELILFTWPSIILPIIKLAIKKKKIVLCGPLHSLVLPPFSTLDNAFYLPIQILGWFSRCIGKCLV